MSTQRAALSAPPSRRLAAELFRFEGLRARLVLGIYGAGLLFFALLTLANASRLGEFELRPIDLGRLSRSLLFAMGIVWAARSPTLTAYPLSLPARRAPHVALWVLMSWTWTMIAAGATALLIWVDRNPGWGMLVLTFGLAGVGESLFPDRVQAILAGRFGLETLLSGNSRRVQEAASRSVTDLRRSYTLN